MKNNNNNFLCLRAYIWVFELITDFKTQIIQHCLFLWPPKSEKQSFSELLWFEGNSEITDPKQNRIIKPHHVFEHAASFICCTSDADADILGNFPDFKFTQLC